MGVVYRAYDTVLRRDVALKRLAGRSSTERLRFLREARLAGSLRHPNIVGVHDLGEADGSCFIAMELIEGPGWQAVVEQLNTREATSLIATICGAVGFAHSRGIVHRDIKPGNVLLDQMSVPYLADFGLAVQPSGGMSERLTASGEALGTPAYMSPEQIEGKLDCIGPQSDVWSLGVMLYELITGSMPFERSTLSASLMAALNEDPVAPRVLNGSIPLDLETICLKCLEKEPSRRYADAHELEDDLLAFLGDNAIEARPPSWGRRVARRVRRAGRFPTVVVVLAISLALSLVGWHAWRSVQYATALQEAMAHHSASGQESLVAQEKRLELARDHARQALFYSNRSEAVRLLSRIRADLAEVRGARQKKARLLKEAQTIANVLLGPFADGKRAVEEAARLVHRGKGAAESPAMRRLKSRLAEAARLTREMYPDHPVVRAYEGYFWWMVGERERGLAQLTRVTQSASDQPFAHLFLALTLMQEYWQKVSPPEYRYARGKPRVVARVPSAVQRALAQQISNHLRRAANAGAFPNISTYKAYSQFAGGVDALFRGQPDRAVSLLRNVTWDPLLKYEGLTNLAFAYSDLNRYEEAAAIHIALFREVGAHRDCYRASNWLTIQAGEVIGRARASNIYRRALGWIRQALALDSKDRGYRAHEASLLINVALAESASQATPRIRAALEIIGALLAEEESVELIKLRGYARLVSVPLEERYGRDAKQLLLQAIADFTRAQGMQEHVGAGTEVNWGRALARRARVEPNRLKKRMLLRQARVHLDRAVAEAPDDPYGFRSRGLLLIQSSRLADAHRGEASVLLKLASDDLNAAVKLHPEEGQAHSHLALLRVRLADLHPRDRVLHLKKALAHALHAVSLESTSGTCLILGDVRFSLAKETARGPFRRGPFLSAAKAYGQALKLEPDMPTALGDRALIRLLILAEDANTRPKEAEVWMLEAIGDLHAALRLRPNHLRIVTSLLSATDNLVWARTKLGRGMEDAFRRAIKALELALEHGVQPAKSSMRLADDWGSIVRVQQGKKQDATESYKQAAVAYAQAARLIVKDAKLKVHAPRCWAMAGNMHLSLARAIQARVGDVSSRYRRALGCYNKALALDPEHQMARLYRAEVALLLGKMTLAMGDIDRLERMPKLTLMIKLRVARLRRVVAEAKARLRNKPK